MIKGKKVYVITNDVSLNTFIVDKLPKNEEQLEIVQENLNRIKRLQMFKRISQRAGLASYTTLQEISMAHKSIVTNLYNSI